jgi:hypothetical protein
MLSIGAALAMVAACGEGAPGGDGGDPDGGAMADTTPPSPDADPYLGTCIDQVFKCFDWALPCTDTVDGNKLVETFSTGAVYTVDTDTQSVATTSSTGQMCFTANIDPQDPTVTIVEAGGQTFRIQGDHTSDQQTIFCPDGTTAHVAGYRPPFVVAADSCGGP